METETLTSLWGHRWVHALSLLADAVMMPLRLVKLSGFGVDEVWQWLNLRDLTIIQMGLHFITAQRYHILSTFYRLKRIYYKKRFMLHCTSLTFSHMIVKRTQGSFTDSEAEIQERYFIPSLVFIYETKDINYKVVLML